MRACSDWYVRSSRTSCPCSCRRAAASNLSESLHWPLRPRFPASRNPQSILSMPKSEVGPVCGLCQLPGLPRCTDAPMPSRSSVDMMTVSKMAPQSDLVSCSVLVYCLMMMPTSCVVFLHKAAGLFLEPAGTTASPCTSAPVSFLNRVHQPPTRDESACVSSPRLPWGHPLKLAFLEHRWHFETL